MRDTIHTSDERGEDSTNNTPRRVFLKGLGAAATLSAVSKTVSASDQQNWFDDFSDGNTDGWVGDNISISEDSITGDFSLSAQDNADDVVTFPEWVDGPILDTGEEFTVKGTSKIDQGDGTLRAGFGVLDDNGEGALLNFSGEFGVTFLANSGLEEFDSQDSYNTDFDNQWVNWELVTDGEGVIKAKVWLTTEEEPAGYELERELPDRSTPFRIWSGTANVGRSINLDKVEIDGVESISENLQIHTSSWLDYGQTDDFAVSWIDPDTENRTNITDEVTVESPDESLITVDNVANTITATENDELKGRVRLRVEHEPAEAPGVKEVAVGDISVENIDILPLSRRFQATWGDDTVVWIVAAVLTGVGFTRLTSAFGGLGAATLFLTIGWIVGWVGTGIALVGLFTALFIGLNLAANIDYTIQK